MAYIASPMAKAHPPYGDIYHDDVPVIVTTVAEYRELYPLCAMDSTTAAQGLTPAA
jgi:hypothetical protein